MQISPTVPTDFTDLYLIQNGAYTVGEHQDIRRLSRIKNILSTSTEVLTFRDEYGIIGIIGYGGDHRHPQLFAYIDRNFKTGFNKQQFKFIKHMLQYMIRAEGAMSFRSLAKHDNPPANRFLVALGFTKDEEFKDNKEYIGYVLWRTA